MKLKTVGFKTLGCKVNSCETDVMVEQFKKDGFKVVNFDEIADVYVINTCTVTNASAQKSRKITKRARKNNEDAIVAVVGCYSQERPKLLMEMEEVDIILGNNNKNKLLEYISSYDGERKESILDISDQTEFEDYTLENAFNKTRTFLKIQDGCNEFCSYCIIPYVRGRIRSKSVSSVLDEVEMLGKKGYKEIVFTGIHVASYGTNLEEDIDLIDILEKSSEVKEIKRLRLSSIEPTFLTKENVERLSKIDKLANHFHLSLQSGSDSVLKRMNRNYDTEYYKKVVDYIRKFFDNPSITTDIIVGFPGETDEEFKETCDFVKNIGFSQVHVFRYSKRDGTRAADMKNQVNGKTSLKRSKKLQEITDELKKKYEKNSIGNQVEVLFEGYDKKEKLATGLSNNYIRVYVDSDYDIYNKFLKIKLKSYDNNKVYGEILEN